MDASPHTPKPDPTAVPVRPETTLIALMGYNRGSYLANAVRSIKQNAPDARLVIVDDGSADPETLTILQNLARRHRVMVSRMGDDRVYLRGLHANMNAVLDIAAGERHAHVFFMQDDQQLVRPLDAGFYDEATRAFAADSAIGLVSPMFFKGFFTTGYFRERYAIDTAGGFYHEREARQFGIGDIGLLDVARLAAKGFRYAATETTSSDAAARLGLRFVLMRNPVLMYTPWPATTRDHPDTIGRMNLGLHPFDAMTSADIDRLCRRPIEEFPVAEHFLRTVETLRRPWWYTVLNDDTVRQYNALVRQKLESGEA